MHKRILCVLLTALMLLSLIPEFALPSQAASDMKTSEECIAILKKMEGFVKFPMYDNGQYSVGYGSGCDQDEYPDGITEEEADALLRAYLADMEKALNNLADSQGVLFSQNQFDALMLFTYNCGTSWMGGDGEFRQAVLDNRGGNTFLFLITQWCTASGQLNMTLVNRRLIEADMYLNGSYTNEKPDHFTYVLYNYNEGVGRIRAQGFNTNQYASVQAVPTRTGYRFLGWYTAAVGGVWVRELTAEHSEKTLYAHWQSEDITPETVPTNIYQIPANTLMSRELFNKPNGISAGSLDQDTLVVIRAEYADENGVKWGKLANGNWVKLGSTLPDGEEEAESQNGVKVTVTGDYVNVRSGPGTEYPSVSGVTKGYQLLITEAVRVDGVLWGKFRGGWLSLQFTTYSGGLTVTEQPSSGVPEITVPETTEPQAPESETVTGIPATVISKSGLNIRSGAGTGYKVVGSYGSGQKIGILEQKMVGGVAWGRTDKGWVCMQYVRVDEDWTAESGVYGTVTSSTRLNIRSGPGVSYAPVGKYAPGEKLVILEQTTASGQKWGRTEKGWICMDYVRLGESVIDDSEPETTVPESTKPVETTGGTTGTVTASRLNIRAAAGTQGALKGSYSKGDKVTILEQKTVGGAAWGRTDKGWICLAYVQLEVSDEGTGRTYEVTATSLRIRKGPGTGNAVLGSCKQGERVTILETVKVGGTTWGRTDKGWICMDYVK